MFPKKSWYCRCQWLTLRRLWIKSASLCPKQIWKSMRPGWKNLDLHELLESTPEIYMRYWKAHWRSLRFDCLSKRLFYTGGIKSIAFSFVHTEVFHTQVVNEAQFCCRTKKRHSMQNPSKNKESCQLAQSLAFDSHAQSWLKHVLYILYNKLNYFSSKANFCYIYQLLQSFLCCKPLLDWSIDCLTQCCRIFNLNESVQVYG